MLYDRSSRNHITKRLLPSFLIYVGLHLGKPVALPLYLIMSPLELEMVNVFRIIRVVGALLGFARFAARDKQVIA